MSKRTLRRVVLLLCAAGAAAAHASESGDWKKAERTNTSVAYYLFSLKHPNSPQAAEARRRSHELGKESAWAVALRENKKVNYEMYAKEYPDSPHLEEARRKIKEFEAATEWESIRKSDNEGQYRYFIGKYPESPNAVEATLLAEAARVRRVNDDWNLALKSNRTNGYQYFIERNPDAPQVNEARERIVAFINERERTLLAPLSAAIAQPTELRTVPLRQGNFARNLVVRAPGSVLTYNGGIVQVVGDLHAKRPGETAYEPVTAERFAVVPLVSWPEDTTDVVAHTPKGSWPIGYVIDSTGTSVLVVPRELIPCELEFQGSLRTRIPLQKTRRPGG